MEDIKLVSKYKPAGDQEQAIEKLTEGLKSGKHEQVLLGATGTGKTFTVANVIEKYNKPTLILAHNKTLAAQLYEELKALFPNNRVEYFISYFDYYQPESYLPGKDLYIEKDSQINAEIERMLHSTTASLAERNDVIVVASVSCIFGIGSPLEYRKHVASIRKGEIINQRDFIEKLIDLQYQRNDVELKRGTFRVKGDIVEFINSYKDNEACRVEFFGDEIDDISYIDTITNKRLVRLNQEVIYPSSHYVIDPNQIKDVVAEIKSDLKSEIEKFESENKLLEAQRLKSRTQYDLEMISEIGFCTGMENYSRYFTGKKKGETPYTLIDHFPDDFLMIIDESHVTLPQVRGMSGGDRSRKTNLVEYGFRLEAAKDNRPLNFDEFIEKLHNVIYVSATPGDYEIERVHGQVIEQIIRPTGLLDPIIEVRPKENQIDDIINEITNNLPNKTLITTLTKKMAEDLTDYLKGRNIKVAYLHSEVKTLERIEIIQKLRRGIYDVIIGINLLREGLDIPEVSRVLILDADKEGFLRSHRSLIQTIGRAARNSDGKVIMYADKETDSLAFAIEETKRRRAIQEKYNEEHHVEPTTIKKDFLDLEYVTVKEQRKKSKKLNKEEQSAMIKDLKKAMDKAVADLNFEEAAEIRDLLFELEGKQ